MRDYKKIIFSFYLAVFVFTVVAPQPAHAQFADVIGGPTTIVKYIWEKVEKVYDVVQGIVGAELANRTVEMFLNTMAYDIATQLASGGPGGKPLFRVKSMEATLRKATESAAGEFIGRLTEEGFDDLGINLCNPSASLKLTYTLSLIDSEAPPPPACEWRNIVREWGNFEQDVQNDLIKLQLLSDGSSVTSTKAFFEDLSEHSDLEEYNRLSVAFNNKKIEAEKALTLSVEECQGFLDNKAPVSEDVISACFQYKELHELIYDKAAEDARNIEATKYAATNKKLSDILRSAADRFTNTFTSKLLRYYVNRPWSLFGNKDSDIYKDYRTSLLDRLRGGSDLLQPRNSDIFKSFKTIDIGQLESYDYLTNLTLCPDEFSNPDNCTMSPSFLQAVTASITLEEAIEQGIINGNLSFIGPEDPMNNSKERCYQDALCHSNLIKLRKLNIIPVGWEMASMRGSVTLAEAMNCFEDGGNCKYAKSDDYAIDGVAHNPFYHLIDGNWLLKAPDATCDAYVYSANLESSESSNRQQYCADPKICLREDENGNCLDGQYGYCTRSENVWRFDGEQCENGEEYAGCLTFGNADFGEASYVESTLDYCTSDEAGCRRYSQEQANDGSWVLGDIAVDDNDLFLNKQSSSCEADQAGCSEFIVLAANTNANILPNGDFEIWEDIASAPEGYSGTGVYSDQGGVNGSNAVLAVYNNSGIHEVTCYNNLIVSPNTNYTVSIDVKINSADVGDGAARISVDGCQDINGNAGDISSPDNSMILDNDAIDPFSSGIDPADEANLLVPTTKLSSDYYTRITGSFNSGDSAVCSSICVGANYGNEKPHYFDNFKLEVVGAPKLDTSYTSYGDGATVYMDSSRFMCLAEEVGCQGYTPTSGDPMVPAVLGPDDLCPAECVGYSTFTEQTDIFDIMENPNALVDYYNFIPDTAQNCPAQDVGCEEFTNLEEVAAGGEGREYYTYLRQCVPENYATVYYTWEGTDVAGYQIKTWSALESNLNNAPCTNITPGTDNCVDTIDTAALCGEETPANPNDDPIIDPNCREFFDASGNSHFRFQDRVIFASSDCHEYRRTQSGQLYKAIPSLSESCSASSNNCRSYYGNTSNNLRTVFNDNFEKGTYSPWEATAGANIDLSNESLNNNGHSLKITKTANLATIWRDASQLLRNDKEYELSWWMKNNAFISKLKVRLYVEDAAGRPIVASTTCGGVATQVQSILLHECDDLSLQNIGTGNWQKYTVANLVDILGPNADLNTLKIAIDIEGNLGDIFLDNIILKEVNDSFAVIRNSWQTPISCDDPYVGYHLGCQAYTDTNGNPFNIKSFSRLCREQAIGCLPAIDTHNSSYPFAETFNAGDFSEIVVPDDSITYLVPDVASYCSPSLKGCLALGFESRQDPGQFETIYKINDPDLYHSTLCNYSALGCEEYTSAKGPYYFKDPGVNTCTYQENFSSGGSKFSGWFKTSTLADAVPSGCSDDADGVLEPEDLQFLWDYCHAPLDSADVWDYFNSRDCESNGGVWFNYTVAAACPAEANLCTSFKDPSDPLNCDPNIINPNILGYCSNSNHDNEADCKNGRCSDPLYLKQTACVAAGEIWEPAGLWTARCQDYYYYDEQIDESSCNGQVDRNGGCMLFFEANKWDAQHTEIIGLYDASRTYRESSIDDAPLSPISCDSVADPSCNLNANRLIKVRADRQCAEWLSCKSSTAVFDPDSGEYKVLCDALSTCIEYEDSGDSNGSKCKTWASYDDDLSPLNFALYQTRTSGPYDRLEWGDKEYTGYSIPDYLPIKDLSVYNFGDSENPDPRLVYGVYDDADVLSGKRYFSGCVDTNLENLESGTACSTLIADEDFYGECQNGLCLVSPKAGQNSANAFAVETRGYAIADAPFPAAIVSAETGERLRRYDGANLCETDPSGNANGCESGFIKASYGYGNVFYYYPSNMSYPLSVCTAGDEIKIGQDCNKNNSFCDSTGDNNDGICSSLKEIVSFNNWSGVCLEYDYSSELVMDGGVNSYTCNQWYPTARISGTSSLYDNYAEAGYYDVSGQDALFCAMAEPYEVPEDRFYCAAQVKLYGSYYCTVLAKVPAGTRVHSEGLNNNSGNVKFSDTIVYGYLNNGSEQDGGILISHGPNDAVQEGGVNFAGLGVYWLERRGARDLFTGGNREENNRDPVPLSAGADLSGSGDGSSLFYAPDFDPNGVLGLKSDSEIPVLPLNNLDTIFDVADGSATIELFYYDNDVDRNGGNNWKAGVVWPHDIKYPIGLYEEYGVQLTEDRVENDLRYCRLGFHESWYNDFLDGDFNAEGGWDQRGWDGDERKEQSRWCSPMANGIYIRPSFTNDDHSLWLCSEYDCGDNTYNSRLCLQAQDTYKSIEPSSNNCAAGDINCEYVHCVESLNLSPMLTIDSSGNQVSALYCSLFGEAQSNSINVTYTCPSGQIYIEEYESTEAASISGCLSILYETTVVDIPASKVFGTETCQASSGLQYSQLGPKTSANSTLISEVGECVSSANINNTDISVPLDGVVDHIPVACGNITLDTGDGWWDLSSTRSLFSFGADLVAITGAVYTPSTVGTDCTDLGCYQQCSTVTQLDDLGELSWVRTDIWWRDENEIGTTNGRLILPRWSSWYYDNNDYIIKDDVTYDDIISQQYQLPSHFGAARRGLEGTAVATRAPLTSALDQLAAATFFGYYNVASTTRASVWLYASSLLNNLFARAYNFDWDAVSSQYIDAGAVSTESGNNRNIYARRDYNPRALAVCGNELCEVKDEVTGQVIDYENGIAINDVRRGPLYGSGGSFFVNVKFFYYAHPDHMPISSIDVDWGDGLTGNYDLSPGRYKNNLPDCDSDKIMPDSDNSLQGFGGQSRACQESFKVLYHDYQYDLDSAGITHPCNGINGSPAIAHASCYKPTVRITDQWGWSSTFSFGANTPELSDDWIVVYRD